MLLYVPLFAILFMVATDRANARSYLYLLLFLLLVFLPFATIGLTLFAVFRQHARKPIPSVTSGGTTAVAPPRIANPIFVGIMMIGLGLASFFALRNWFFQPVDQAISLKPGTIRTNFRVLKENEYFIDVTVDRTACNDPLCPASPDWQYRSVLKAEVEPVQELKKNGSAPAPAKK